MYLAACMFATLALAHAGWDSESYPLQKSLPTTEERSFRGQIRLHVDATDTRHGVFHTVETIPLQSHGEMILLYPEWETTSHSATASAVELADLRIEAGGRALAWRRDSKDVHAFHVNAPLGTQVLTVSFDFLPHAPPLFSGMDCWSYRGRECCSIRLVGICAIYRWLLKPAYLPN